jgi:hypothetical protein
MPRINIFIWRFNLKTIIAKSVLLPFVVAATIPVVTYAGEVITPKKMSVPQVSTPHPTTAQGTPPSTGQPNLFHRYQLGTVEVGKYKSGSTGGAH